MIENPEGPSAGSQIIKKFTEPAALIKESFVEMLHRRQTALDEAFASGVNRLRSDNPERLGAHGSRHTGPPQDELTTRYVRERAGRVEEIKISTIVPKGEEITADLSRFRVVIVRPEVDDVRPRHNEFETFDFSRDNHGRVRIGYTTSDVALAQNLRDLQDPQRSNTDNLLDRGWGLRFSTKNALRMKKLFDEDLPHARRETYRESLDRKYPQRPDGRGAGN